MDDMYRFVFWRTDLTKRQQMVQSNHAAFILGTLTGELPGIPNVVAIGVPNQEELEKVKQICNQYQIPFYPYVESDGGLGFTALATAPIDKQTKEVFAGYQTWR